MMNMFYAYHDIIKYTVRLTLYMNMARDTTVSPDIC